MTQPPIIFIISSHQKPPKTFFRVFQSSSYFLFHTWIITSSKNKTKNQTTHVYSLLGQHVRLLFLCHNLLSLAPAYGNSIGLLPAVRFLSFPHFYCYWIYEMIESVPSIHPSIIFFNCLCPLLTFFEKEKSNYRHSVVYTQKLKRRAKVLTVQFDDGLMSKNFRNRFCIVLGASNSLSSSISRLDFDSYFIIFLCNFVSFEGAGGIRT